MMKSEENYFCNSDNGFKFTSSSNFFKPVYIFQTRSHFLNQFICTNWFIFFQTSLIFSFQAQYEHVC